MNGQITENTAKRPFSDRQSGDIPITPPRRLTERALALMLVALFLWIPPLVGMFSLDGMVFGLPILFVYFFAGWGILIIFCALLTRALRNAAQSEGR
ncbi:hypothetical protein [Thalassospira sp.]|nr:hypothetical protein [Thalassospira sp.]